MNIHEMLCKEQKLILFIEEETNPGHRKKFKVLRNKSPV